MKTNIQSIAFINNFCEFNKCILASFCAFFKTYSFHLSFKDRVLQKAGERNRTIYFPSSSTLLKWSNSLRWGNQSQEPGTSCGSPTWMQVLKDLNHLLLPSKATSSELNQKQDCQEMNLCPYRMPMPQAKG